MRKTKAFTCNGKTRIACELTPREIDALFDATRERSLLDDLLDVHDLDTGLLAAMLGMENDELAAELMDLPPSEIQVAVAACKEVNADFFVMARRRRELVGQMVIMEKMLAAASEKGSAASSSAATTVPPTTD